MDNHLIVQCWTKCPASNMSQPSFKPNRKTLSRPACHSKLNHKLLALDSWSTTILTAGQGAQHDGAGRLPSGGKGRDGSSPGILFD